MDIAKSLALIDLLCTREFPGRYGRTEHGESGPGYHMAALQTSGDFREDDGTEREETQTQYEADRDGTGERLVERWGPPDVFSLFGFFRRITESEDLAEPWAGLGSYVSDVQLWKSTETGRWVGLGVSQ